MKLTDEQIIEIGKRHFREGHKPEAIPNFVAAVRECLSSALATEGGERCKYCDGTGDVHGFDGEWRGVCTECDAAS